MRVLLDEHILSYEKKCCEVCCYVILFREQEDFETVVHSNVR